MPQRDALRIALGLAAGPPPDQFLVGLAVLSLLSEVAGGQPLIWLIDDEQWLDQATKLTLGFVARRLAADPVALVFATRGAGAELAGQPELVVAGLKKDHARALLDSALAGPLEAGLVEFDGHMLFRHPLTRPAAYRSAPLVERQQLRAALVEVTDPQPLR